MIKIDITLDPTLGDMEDQLAKHMKALGFYKSNNSDDVVSDWFGRGRRGFVGRGGFRRRTDGKLCSPRPKKFRR